MTTLTIEGRVLRALKDAGDYINASVLIEQVWSDGEAPNTAEQLVRKAVLRLRERGFVILSRPGRKSRGYLLRSSPSEP